MQNFILWIISHTPLFPMRTCHASTHPAACDSLRRPSIEERIGAPPAGAEPKVRAMRKAAVHFSGRCEVIVSVFFLWWMWEHSVARLMLSLTAIPATPLFFFSRKKKIKKAPSLLPGRWAMTVQHTWQFLLSSSSNKLILSPPPFLFWQQCTLYLSKWPCGDLRSGV